MVHLLSLIWVMCPAYFCPQEYTKKKTHIGNVLYVPCNNKVRINNAVGVNCVQALKEKIAEIIRRLSHAFQSTVCGTSIVIVFLFFFFVGGEGGVEYDNLRYHTPVISDAVLCLVLGYFCLLFRVVTHHEREYQVTGRRVCLIYLDLTITLCLKRLFVKLSGMFIRSLKSVAQISLHKTSVYTISCFELIQ